MEENAYSDNTHTCDDDDEAKAELFHHHVCAYIKTH